MGDRGKCEKTPLKHRRIPVVSSGQKRSRLKGKSRSTNDERDTRIFMRKAPQPSVEVWWSKRIDSRIHSYSSDFIVLPLYVMLFIIVALYTRVAQLEMSRLPHPTVVKGPPVVFVSLAVKVRFIISSR